MYDHTNTAPRANTGNRTPSPSSSASSVDSGNGPSIRAYHTTRPVSEIPSPSTSRTPSPDGSDRSDDSGNGSSGTSSQIISGRQRPTQNGYRLSALRLCLLGERRPPSAFRANSALRYSSVGGRSPTAICTAPATQRDIDCHNYPNLTELAAFWQQISPLNKKGRPKPGKYTIDFYMEQLWSDQESDPHYIEKIILETLLRTFEAPPLGNNIILVRLLLLAYVIGPEVYEINSKKISGIKPFGMNPLCIFSHGGRVVFDLGDSHQCLTNFIFNGAKKMRRFSSHGIQGGALPEKSVGPFGNINRKTQGAHLAIGGHGKPNLFAAGTIEAQGNHGHLCINKQGSSLLVGVENSGTLKTSFFNGAYHGPSCTPKDLSAFMLPKFSNQLMKKIYNKNIPDAKMNGLHVCLRSEHLDTIVRIIQMRDDELVGALVRTIKRDLCKMQRR
jgi:hypothetical protein